MKVAGLQLFGPAHLWTLTLIAIVGSIIVLTVPGNPAVARSVAFSLAALLVVNAAMTYGTRLATDRFDVSTWCLFDANYGYLREKPQRASLLDYLGPWPIYIGGLEIVAAFAFFVL